MTAAAPPRLTGGSHAPLTRPGTGLAAYLGLGILFGVVLVKAEVVSWFRIQEMFRFQSFHMYGVIMSAVAVAAASLRVIKRRERHALSGEVISIPPKQWGRGYRYWLGGGTFGVGWALTGACPGPMFALLGNASVMAVSLAGAMAGTWLYGYLRPRLPH
jgi:uncharacterized membrane protein YedE/YeeE